MAQKWKNWPPGSNWGEFGPDDQLGRDGNFAAFRRKFCGVGVEVVEYLDQRPFIAAQRRKVRGDLSQKSQSGGLCGRRQLSETALQQSGNVQLGIGEFVLARFDLGDVENIVDQVEE